MTTTWWCRVCDVSLTARNRQPGRNLCQYCARDQSRTWAKDRVARMPPDVLAAERRRVNLMTRYNLTVERFQEMLDSQGGLCAICDRRLESGRSKYSLAIDHDHSCCPDRRSCGECVRGILCGPCNRGLGQFEDDREVLAKAIAYLARSKARL